MKSISEGLTPAEKTANRNAEHRLAREKVIKMMLDDSLMKELQKPRALNNFTSEEFDILLLECNSYDLEHSIRFIKNYRQKNHI